MTLDEIRELELELEKARGETLKDIIAHYQNDLTLISEKKECVELAEDIFKNSFRMLNKLKEEKLKKDDN